MHGAFTYMNGCFIHGSSGYGHFDGFPDFPSKTVRIFCVGSRMGPLYSCPFYNWGDVSRVYWGSLSFMLKGELLL